MTLTKIVAPKKLIEVALPLDAINKACAREKSIRHGHPSTLHLWWARRPLAAARAVLFAQMVNDPSWKYSEEELKKPQVKSAVTRKRNELFRLITELVQWENTTNPDVLSRAQAEIRASWKETCEANAAHPNSKTLFNPENLPGFHDPFAGGGAIPLEAQRLGLEAHATDLNPVAVLINKAMIEIPAIFVDRPPIGPIPEGERQSTSKSVVRWTGTQGLAEDVRRYGEQLLSIARERLEKYYPAVRIEESDIDTQSGLARYRGRTLTPIAWLWTRTVRCPNPACGCELPLVKNFALSTKRGRGAYAVPMVDKKSGTVSFRIKAGKSGQHLPTITGVGAKCLQCDGVVPFATLREHGRSGTIRHRLLAVVVDGDRERVYLSPRHEWEEVALNCKPPWAPSTPLPDKALGFRIQEYGMSHHRDIFSARQLLMLATLSDLVTETRARIRADADAQGWHDEKALEAGGAGAPAYADAVALYLAFVVDQVVNHSTSLCGWNGVNDQMRSLFSRNAISMAWDFAEANPLSESTGSFRNLFDRMVKAFPALPARPQGKASQLNAADLPSEFKRVISFDPPYYDNIGYADMSDVFYSWLRVSAIKSFPSVCSTLVVPKADEMIANPYRHGGRDGAEAFFNERMTSTMQRVRDAGHPAFPSSVYYAFKQTDNDDDEGPEGEAPTGTTSTGWATFLTSIVSAGLKVVGTWPLRTEKPGRMRDISSNALAGSIALVLRARGESVAVSRREFLRELSRAMPDALGEMIADPIASIAPVDLAQACIGPGMALFSKYQAVLEADGSSMTVHNAIIHINKAIDEYFAHAEGDLDADSRFCIGWFEQNGFEPGEFGKADVLARAKGTSVNGVKEAGVVEAGKGRVRLLSIQELPKKWDPTMDARTPVWEALHHMCKALAESEGDAGVLLSKMPQKGDGIRQLAYRLYTLCAERKKQAELGRPYNDLITSWPAIVEASQKTARKQLGLL